MDVSSVQTTALASGLDQRDVVGTRVLKKAMDIQKQTAMQLIESIPEVQSQPTGSLGNSIDIYA